MLIGMTVVLNGSDGAERPETRTLIRKQAMKEASIIRKRKGDYGRVNLGQPILVKRQPSPLPAHRAPEVGTSEPCDRCSVVCPKSCHCTVESCSCQSFDPADVIPGNKEPSVRFCAASKLSMTEFTSTLSAPLSTGYERVRNMSNIDLSELSMLASFRANTKITAALLYAEPSLLASFLRKRQLASYLLHVPALYNSSECLAAATDCLLVKVANVLSTAINHPSKRNQEIILHSKALQSLRTALTDSDAFSDARILVAIQLLSLYELLNFSPNDNGTAWSMHVNAGATFIQAQLLRFETDLEKSLLFSHSGAILSESFSANSDCYLDQLEWKDLYNSLATTEVNTSRGDEVTSHPSMRETRAHSLLFSLPGLINDVDRAMRSDSLVFNDRALLSLRQRCQRLHSAVRKWLNDYTKGSMSNKSAYQSVADLEIHDRYWEDELLPTMFDTSLLTARLLSILTICPRARLKREEKVQEWAAQALAASERQNHLHAHLPDILAWSMVQHTLKISQSILATKETLSPQSESCADSKEAQIRAMRRRYMQWHALLY